MKNPNRLKPAFSMLLLCCSLLAAKPLWQRQLMPDSVTTQGPTSERGVVPNGATHDTYDALTRDGKRSKQSSDTAQQAPSANNAVAINTDFWFYDAYVTLFADDDADGYFTGIELEFDADTVYTAADVYAVTYLSLDYGPWNVYAETADLRCTACRITDEYVIENGTWWPEPAGDRRHPHRVTTPPTVAGRELRVRKRRPNSRSCPLRRQPMTCRLARPPRWSLTIRRWRRVVPAGC